MTRFAAELMGVLKGQSLSDETEKRIRFTPVRIAEFRFPFFIHEKQKSNTFSFFSISPERLKNLYESINNLGCRNELERRSVRSLTFFMCF